MISFSDKLALCSVLKLIDKHMASMQNFLRNRK
jgi:hypothetical protein